jgi:hypothetical protein
MGRVGGEVDRPNESHKVPVVIAMAVVVPKNPSVVYPTPFQIDVCKVVGNNGPILEPDFLFENRALAFAFERVDFDQHGLNRASSLAHKVILSQTGQTISYLPISVEV